MKRGWCGERPGLGRIDVEVTERRLGGRTHSMELSEDTNPETTELARRTPAKYAYICNARVFAFFVLQSNKYRYLITVSASIGWRP